MSAKRNRLTYLLTAGAALFLVSCKGSTAVCPAGDPLCDPAPTLPELSINDVTVTEGDEGSVDAVFTVTLSARSEQAVRVNYATADATAVASDDYMMTSGQLTFASGGSLTQQVTVPVLGDVVDEGTEETFTVGLTGPVNATIAAGTGTGTITDDDVCVPTGTIDVEETVSGALASGDCELSVGRFMDAWTLTLTDAQPVQIDMMSGDFDAWLGITDGTAAVVDFDDDGGAGTDARLSGPLAAGTYTIWAGSAGAGETGSYDLSVDCGAQGTIEVGETVAGTLASGDCPLSSGHYQQLWKLTLSSETTVQIDLSSTDFDAYLELEDEFGTFIDEDDDNGGGPDGLDSRIAASLPPGTYVIIASTFDPHETGDYLLSVTEPAPAPPVIADLMMPLEELNGPACAAVNGGSLFTISFDYLDPNADVTESDVVVNWSFTGQPSGTSGTFVPTLDFDGTPYTGTISWGVCFIFTTETSVDITVSITDEGGLESNTLMINVPKPVGANVAGSTSSVMSAKDAGGGRN